MFKPSLIDAHIHLDMYKAEEREKILRELDLYAIKALISVSCHIRSSRQNVEWSKRDERIKAAAGFHPEQELPSDGEVGELLTFIERHHKELVAIGEIGLPYYKMKENPEIVIHPYMELLERFLVHSKKVSKPVILHAVYEHASIACDLLEKHSVEKAHFHWFKGDGATIDRMIENGYSISITPDVLYEENIRELVKRYPMDGLMVETDGPWRFEGVFRGRMTHPGMMHNTIEAIAVLKGIPEAEVYKQVYQNTCDFYEI
ncbi:TatD family hydrolase [Rossellomorea sp. AcN35-11]|nr:TatD family hydrolase [Rossellomorea aquimaris]WJV29336.1 TatD family hydrolase [Rossellomorea sp. AcN35-11]